MPFLIVSVRPLYLGLTLLSLLTVSAFSQDRDAVARRCLSIVDVNERVDCLETGIAPGSPAAASNSSDLRQPRANPNFECRAARTSIERAICADTTLSEWDSRMGQIFQQVLRRAKDSQPLLENQRVWLTERESRCGTIVDSAMWSCLLEMTKSRAAILAKGITTAADAIPPALPSLTPTTSTISQSRSAEISPSETPSKQAAPSAIRTAQEDRSASTPSPDGSATFFILLIVFGVGLLVTIKVLRVIRRNQLIAAQEQQVEALRIAEQHRLISKYGEQIAAGILAHQIWQGMTDEQLAESWGTPADVGYEIIRSRRRETWKYGQTGRNRFSDRVYLENGVVIGWKR